MLPPKFQFIWESGFRREDFLEINQSETRISKDASYQISIYLAKRFQRPCLSTDQDKMSNPYRGPSIDTSYQVTVHLA